MKKITSLLLAIIMLFVAAAPMSTLAKPDASDAQIEMYDHSAKRRYYVYSTEEPSGNISTVKGISYSYSSNTLTITDVKKPQLDILVENMGSDFKIKVNGTCEIGRLNVLFCGLTVTGYGTLSINQKKKNDYAIMGDALPKFVLDKYVTLKLYAKKQAIHLVYCKKDIFTFKNGAKPGISSTLSYTKTRWGYIDTGKETGYKAVGEYPSEKSILCAFEYYETEKNGYPEMEYAVYSYLYSKSLDRYFRDEFDEYAVAYGTYEELLDQGIEILKDDQGNFIKNDFTDTSYVSRSLAKDSKGNYYVYDSNKNVYSCQEIPELYDHYYVDPEYDDHPYLPYSISTVYCFNKSSVKLEDLTKVYDSSKNSYTHSLKKTTYIYAGKPKEVSISKLSKGKGSVKATWKKAAGVSGYQIQFATNKKFTQNKKSFKLGSSATSKNATKLKRRRTYYVRIRSYKTVNGKTEYSKWSAIKSITTK
jgi:hypothetical protein